MKKNHTPYLSVKAFFVNYAWIGVILILLSVIGQHENTSNNEYLSILYQTIKTIGIAILVASVFTFASGTSRFINKVQDILSEMLLSPDFFGDMDTEKKRDVIRSLLKPSSDANNKYANIDNYYNSMIEKTLAIPNKCFRSQYKLSCHPYWDKDNNVIVVDEYISYRLYPSVNGYDNIRIVFYDDHAIKKPECVYINIYSSLPGGKSIEKRNLPLTEKNGVGQKVLFAEVPLTDFGREHPHLDIDMHLREIGRSHWQIIGFQTLLPTDGFSLVIECAPPVRVQSVNSFWAGVGLHINEQSDYILSASSTQWMCEGTRISVLVSTTNNENTEKVGVKLVND